MKKRLLFVTLSLVLAACGSKEHPNSSSHADNLLIHTIDPTIAQLKDSVGEPSTLQTSSMLPLDRALTAAADDYGPRTGKWFEGDNGFNILTSTVYGEVKAGSDIGTGISKIPEGRSVRFQITSRDSKGKRLKLIMQEIATSTSLVDGRFDFIYKLPEQPNSNYILSIEILNTNDVVEDTFLCPVYVPAHELNARLTVKPPETAADQTELTLYNAGPTNLYFGYGYSIYHKEPDGWTLVPDDSAVEAIGLQAKPGETFVEKVMFPRKLEAGQYRLVKRLNGYMTDLTATLAADFKVR
ncbi:hypothetical protein A8990_12629 [Paenibacillus taihuensis]|uniref:Bacterial Ig-like domain-containing protein n=1 Tax=Paenibacillus taihuensis TaxID=1156355 RepID=A0A3D9RQ15_9BACL|nr:immunoglobulin-like domain-containing protein [Paenibacillus taihuensis]REE78555.1 hypothetical protein A8990_12629 [Paenibacillus taihuensis]